MALTRVADGGDGLQKWRVATNIFNNSHGEPTRDCPPDWGLGEGLKLLSVKINPVCYAGSQLWTSGGPL
jgi:hypothetical protein